MRERITQNGWRQGSLFRAADLPEDFDWNGGRKEKYIFAVLPYSCAVVNANLNDEPSVEVIRLSKEDREYPHWMHSQHERNLLLPIVALEEGSIDYYRARMADRYFLPKEVLANFSPNANFEFESRALEQLISWITKRYTRAAFPDDFNAASGEAMKSLHQFVQELATDVANTGALTCMEGIYIRVTGEEEAAFYEIEFLLLTTTESASLEHQEIYQQIQDKIGSEFTDLEGVELDGIEIASKHEVPIGTFEQFQRLEYDHVSFEIEENA